MPVCAYIGFGSNVGDLAENHQVALDHLCGISGISKLKSSPLFLSEPLTKKSAGKQSWYLNAVFECQCDLPLRDLFWALTQIEKKMGRLSGKGQWKPRVVDLDLLFYGDVIYQSEDLQVPHKGISDRRFVLEPLCALNPDWKHPEFHMTVADLLASVQDPLQVKPYDGRSQAC